MDKRTRTLQAAQRRLEQPGCRALAVDVEALTPLPLWEERDLFALVEADVRRQAAMTDLLDFPALRMEARGHTLEEVYDDLSNRLLGVNIRQAAEKERALRLRLPVLMQDVHGLVRLARKLGKQVILFQVGPSMLTEAEIRRMLQDRGAEMPDVICVGKWHTLIGADDAVTVSYGARLQGRCHVLPLLRAGRGKAEDLFRRQRSFLAAGEAPRYIGVRAVQAMAALHPGENAVDAVGYGMLGPYLLAQAMWLAREMQQGGFDRLVFLARDGFWVKQAFDCVAAAMGLELPTDYVRVSRQAVFPLHFRQAADLLSIPCLTDVTAHTPRTLLALLAPVCRSDAVEPLLKQWGIPMDQRLTEESFLRFARLVGERLFDREKADDYRQHAERYLKPRFSGRCATFDVGYNLRSEAVIRDVTGAEITAFITHTDSDAADRRGLPYRTLYPASPWVSWVAREQFLLEDAPASTGYGASGPVLAESGPVNPAIRRAQEQAMAFVQAMADAYGPNLTALHFRPSDVCAAFETFLHTGPRRLMKPFADSRVENAFLEGTSTGDSTCLAWQLMQTDFRAALRGEPRWMTKLRRGLIRLEEDPAGLLRKLSRRG